MKIGDFTLHVISDGFFKLDGGAMFGVVPKVIWEKMNPPDEKNRIILGLNPLLIRKGGENILVDTGIGGKGGQKFNSIFGVDRTPSLQDSLADLGLKPEEITMVINTHLHFDHAGGNTVKDEKGKIRPAFPNARYLVQRGEWEDATHSNERTRASYLSENFLPVMEAGQMELLDGDQEIMEGISVFKTSGHIRHIQLVKVSSKGQTAVYLADIIPTVSHIAPPYIMGYDLYPLETLEAKKKIIKSAVDENWLLIFEHDPRIKMGYVRLEGDKPVVEPV